MSQQSAFATIVAFLPLSCSALAQIAVSDQTLVSGTEFTHVPNAAAIPGPQDYMAAGIAVGDYNNDGFPDIFWAAGGLTPDHLFINNGDGTFTDEAAAWGVAAIHANCGIVLARVTSSASLRRMASSARFRSVMSRAIFDAPTTFPAVSRIGETVSDTSMSCPSLRFRTVS